MSRRRNAARRRPSPQRAPAACAAAPAAAAAPRRLPDDPVVAYREAAGYGRTIRVALLLAVLLLDTPLLIRAAGHDAPPLIGASGVSAMAFFFGAVFIRHLVALHRIRSRQRDLLQPSRRLIAGMLKAPFGVGDPRRTGFDLGVLRATVVLAVAFGPLLIVAGSRA